MPDVSQPRSRVPLGEEFASPCSLYPSGREQDRDHLSAGLLAGPGCAPRVKSRVQDFASNACRPRAEISEIRGGTEGPRRSSSPHGCHLSATGAIESAAHTFAPERLTTLGHPVHFAEAVRHWISLAGPEYALRRAARGDGCQYHYFSVLEMRRQTRGRD